MLTEFYGDECPHCIQMKPLIERLEKECYVTIEKKEVWHNKPNLAELEKIDNGDKCGGVPFFWNSETEKFICGSASYEKLREWVK